MPMNHRNDHAANDQLPRQLGAVFRPDGSIAPDLGWDDLTRQIVRLPPKQRKRWTLDEIGRNAMIVTFFLVLAFLAFLIAWTVIEAIIISHSPTQ